MTETIILRGRKVFGGKTEGEALVSPIPMMGWRNLNPQKGYTTERGHPLYKIPLKDKILVFPEPRGSGGFLYYGSTKQHGTNPKAFLYRKGCALTVFAALEGQIPTMTDFDIDPMKVIASGDYVIVNADEGYVQVIKNHPSNG